MWFLYEKCFSHEIIWQFVFGMVEDFFSNQYDICLLHALAKIVWRALFM